MTRVAIIGNAGGGKSVLARHLGRTLALPVHSIDDVQWEPGWTRAPAGRVEDAQRAWLREGRWIIDGWGSWELIAERFEAADTIVFIDFPLHVHYRWAMRRQVESMLGLRRDWPPRGCAAWPVTRELLRVMRYVHAEARPRLVAMTSHPRLASRVVRLRSPRELRAWRRSVRPTSP
jgi:adenylate kinase family enzyme